MKLNFSNSKFKILIFLGVSLIASSTMAHQAESENTPKSDMEEQHIHQDVHDHKAIPQPRENASIVLTPKQDQPKTIINTEAKASSVEKENEELLRIMKQLSN